MKRWAVVIVALAMVGCGVGADESYDGQTLVTSDGNALTGSSDTTTPTVQNVGSPQVPVTTTGPCTNPSRDPSAVGLPQDPIPVRPNVAQPMDPSMNPLLFFIPGGPQPVSPR